MVTSLPYKPTQSLEWLEGYFKKHYYKKPYNRFMWWRSYTPIKKPLDRRAIFRDKLENGEEEVFKGVRQASATPLGAGKM